MMFLSSRLQTNGWTYRAIYQVNDARVGVWSQSVSVAVPA